MTVILPVKELERARFLREAAWARSRGPGARRQVRPARQRHAGGADAQAGGTKRAEHTALSFKVENIAADIKALKARGVSFHDYDPPGFKTVDHIAVLANEKAAWFAIPKATSSACMKK